MARRLANASKLDVLVWVDADSRDRVVERYAEAARVLLHTGKDLEPEAGARDLLSWLEHTDQRWLIVLDNLKSLPDLTGWWPPPSRRGRTVITTRIRSAVLDNDRRTQIAVGPFRTDEAVSYLLRISGQPASRVDAEALAADLGLLPLALCQAGAFMRDERLDFKAYREILNDRERQISDLLPSEEFLPDDHLVTVARTLSLSIDAANSSEPQGLAYPIISIAAFLDPNAVPIPLFHTQSTIDYLQTRLFLDGTKAVLDSTLIAKSISNLHRLNLVTIDRGGDTFRVHALVQRVVRDSLDPGSSEPIVHVAAAGLSASWTTRLDDDLQQVMRSNVLTLNSLAGYKPWEGGVAGRELLFQAGESLGSMFRKSAADYFEGLHAELKARLGPSHRDTLEAQSRAAFWWCLTNGYPDESLTATRKAFENHSRLLGPDDRHTLQLRRLHIDNLGRFEAEPCAAAAAAALVVDCRRVFGVEDSEYWDARHSLDHWNDMGRGKICPGCERCRIA
ncbi:hypothetical protein ACFWRG_14000 [Micromonospora tulbaghiae]|uniref:hypothetical protein n=1 Tax=Micromonospora tulbaghiae TaxID=479978 RepID=UPI003652A82B